jgi:RHH-type transcriptional regulator, proline utilization regulon repressor / proline dehydrogenase / delta 1-pyrroline-5-carboxylate dehydrogenase
MPDDSPMIFRSPLPAPGPGRAAVSAAYRADETKMVQARLDEADVPADARARIAARAGELVEAVRKAQAKQGGVESFMSEYSLSSREGIVLMCLAEALLRIPDAETADRLIRDKLSTGDWSQHLGQSDSLFVNASTWALMLTGRVVGMDDPERQDLSGTLKRLVQRAGEPVIRQAVMQAMRILGRQFVMGRTIEEALERARPAEEKGYRHSYDMLGEAARTAPDAERYLKSYEYAVNAIGRAAQGLAEFEGPSISVKLSAIHPRYQFAQAERAVREVGDRLLGLARKAKAVGIGLTVDAEEADRLDLSLDIIEAVSRDPSLKGWDGFGLAVQAYQKRARPLVDWLAEVARSSGRRLNVRLVKGAYWDTEIKRGQERGLDGYPVFTRKTATDVSYVACAKALLAARDAFYPQFATHNALTLATVLELAGNRRDFEFQRLHGMGEALYAQIVGAEKLGIACRVYAPTGSHEDLLPYLVRRLLENGANTSFVNRIVDASLPVDAIVADPVAKLRALPKKPHPGIPLPIAMLGSERKNSEGVDLSDPAVLSPLSSAMARAFKSDWRAGPIVGGNAPPGRATEVRDPADNRRVVGAVIQASEAQVEEAVSRAHAAAERWDRTPAAERAAALDRFADRMEERRAVFMAMAVREAGKSIPDALGEVREAADFCRYYAARARADFSAPMMLPGPTGEDNSIELRGRGPFLCISPWNFPLAIFCGQMTAALAAGNTVIAKPAEQTPLIAAEAVRLLHESGIPGDVLHLLPGPGEVVGARLVKDPRIAGVAFTGSTEVARVIAQQLAAKPGPIVPFIAETGGQNAMVVDSSALPEQVVDDVLTSAFQSAGQRCSALRVLFVQDDVADKVLAMLTGAMEELVVGDPALLETDVGPVIDADAKAGLERHAERMKHEAKLLHQVRLGEETRHGTFFAPRAFEIDSIKRLEREVFGPVLHVVRYGADKLDKVIDDINATGYGLTLGVHSRVDETIKHVQRRVRAGNAYINRNIIGAVVGVQPFGGEGLSGTGPKAGGPRYLHRFATERVVSVNATATGGNAQLLSLREED